MTLMCRSPASVCTALGAEPSHWPINQPLPTPPGAREAARAVEESVALARAGDTLACRAVLSTVDHVPLQQWFIDHAQHAYRFRSAAFRLAPVPSIPKAERDRPYPSLAMEREVYRRDDGRCRYCGISVQLREDLLRINALVGDDVFAMGRTNSTRSGSMIIARASADHVVPVTQGGRTTPENLVTACWPCQFGKSSYSPEQLGMKRPDGCSHPSLEMRPATEQEIATMMFCWDCASAEHDRVQDKRASCPKCFLVGPCDCE